MPTAVDDRLQLAVEIAREAGAITLEHFLDPTLAVEQKADASPVTIADRRSEQHLRQRITASFPDDAILGEEFGEQIGTSGFRWILDPIDGTKSFIHGVPLYGTLVGVEHEAESCAGVIHIPALEETVYAAKGRGAWYVRRGGEPAPARVAARAELAGATLLTSSTRGFRQIGRANVYGRLEQAVGVTRTWGDCYGYLLVAVGRADVMIDPIVAVWDVAALLPILEEAGGVLTDWQGRRTIHSGNSVACNPHLHGQVLRLLRSDSVEECSGDLGS